MSAIGRVACAALITGVAVFAGAAPAAAEPPNCTAADLAGIMSGVTAATSAYLFTHPDVNNFFTGLKNTPKDQRQAQIQQYLDANPQIKGDLQGIRQPAADFRARCDVTMPE